MRRFHGPLSFLAILFVLACMAPIAAAQAMTRFDVPAQPLADALRALGSQAKINVLFDPPLVAGHKAPALKANLTIDQALTLLLVGTGIKHEFLNDTTVVLAAPSSTTDTGARISSPNVHPPAPINEDAKKEEGKKGFLDRFRVAQVDQGTSSSSSSVERTAQASQRKPEQLEEVVVTAQKKTENLLDVPVPVTAISGETLVASNQLRLQDYYTNVPGLSVTLGNTGIPNLAIRGVSTGNSTNPTVGIVIDDVPYGSTTSLGDGFVVPDIDPSDLERIEVLRGPQGTLYGASSIGGLLKYVTVDPSTDRVSGRAEAGASEVYHGEHLGYHLRGAVNVPLGDTWAIRASGFYHEDPGYIDNVQTGERDSNRGDAAGGHLAALWRPSEDLSLKLSALLQDTKRFGSPDIYVEPRLGDLQQDVLRGTGGYSNNIQAYSATLKVKLSSLDLTSATGYSINKLFQPLDLSSAFGPLVQSRFGVSGASVVANLKTSKFSQEIRVSTPVGQRIEWLFGGFYTHESNPQGAGSNIFAVDPSTGIAVGTYLNDAISSTYTEYAAFTDLTVHFSDRFDVQIGGRESRNQQGYSQVEAGPYVGDLLLLPSPVVQPMVKTRDDAFTYLVTPRFRVSPDLMVYARLASGYRVGGPNTLSTVFHVPSSFAPDKTQNYEIGVKGDFFHHVLDFDASLYHIDWKNIQLQVMDPVSFEGYVANASRAKSQGVELSVEFKPATGLLVSTWAAWNQAVLTKGFPTTSAAFGLPGDRLPYSSRFSGNFSLEQEVYLANGLTAFVGATESYVGDRVGEFASIFGSPDRQLYPAYFRTDLRAGAKRDSWAINAFVTNLTDRRGVLSGGIGFFPANAFTYIQPRTAGLSIVKSF